MFFRRRRACAKKKEMIDPISRIVIHNKIPYTVCKSLIKTNGQNYGTAEVGIHYKKQLIKEATNSNK